MASIPIYYNFRFADNSEKSFHLEIDDQKFELVHNRPEVMPIWALLSFHQCPHCPLRPETHYYCPLAANFANIVPHFQEFLSYEKTFLSVTTEERTISQQTTVQEAVASLMGLIMAASGCPYTAFFKPMARFHLPLANTTETIYRAIAMYLIAQYFLHEDGQAVDFEFNGLAKVYENIRIVNTAMAERFLVASQKDSTVNAVVQLDIYAMTFLGSLDGPLEEIRHLFHAYLEKINS